MQTVECMQCGAEVEEHRESVRSERGYTFCNGCVTGLVEKVRAQTGAQISDRVALNALEHELFGYALDVVELPAGAELEPSVRRFGGGWNCHGDVVSR